MVTSATKGYDPTVGSVQSATFQLCAAAANKSGREAHQAPRGRKDLID